MTKAHSSVRQSIDEHTLSIQFDISKASNSSLVPVKLLPCNFFLRFFRSQPSQTVTVASWDIREPEAIDSGLCRELETGQIVRKENIVCKKKERQRESSLSARYKLLVVHLAQL